MSIQIVCVGTELLTGETLNTNLQFIAERLDDLGYVVSTETTIHDEPERLRTVIEQAMAESRIVITIGGLGPTRDDLTKETIAGLLEMPLYEDEAVSNAIMAQFSRRKRKLADAPRKKQSMVPTGAEILPNNWGIAPGLWCQKGDCAVVMLPGPPRELHPIFDQHVLPKIKSFLPATVIRRCLAIFGVGESTVEKRLNAVFTDIQNVEPSFCVKFDNCRICLTAKPENSVELDRAIAILRKEFGRDAGEPHETLPTQICDIIRAHGGQWGTAESCTGGWIAKRVIDHAGVSDVFAGGVVTYSNEMKVKLLGVSEASLAEHGAVSKVVAREMVAGLVERYGLLAAVAVTGISGPAGGTPEKPVGLVHIATAVGNDIRHSKQVFAYGRLGMRERTVAAALSLLRSHLLGAESQPELYKFSTCG